MSALSTHSKQAYLVSSIPSRYSNAELNELLESGHSLYADDDDPLENIIQDIDTFGKMAFDYQDDRLDRDLPVVEGPGHAALLATHAALVVKNQEYIADKLSTRGTAAIEPIQDIINFYRENLLRLLNSNEQNWVFGVYKVIAEHLYQKDEYDSVPHPGRVCTDVTQLPDRNGLYLEFPVVAISQNMRVFDGDPDPDNYATLWNVGKENHVYVPIEDLESKFDDALESEFGTLASFVEDGLSPEAETELFTTVSKIPEWIESRVDGNHYDRIWVNASPTHDLLRLIRRILDDDELIDDASQPHTASEIHSAIKRYEPEHARDRRLLSRVDTPQGLGYVLREATQTEQTADRVFVEERDGEPNRYQISRSSGYPDANIWEVADLLEFPCFENIDEKLMTEGKPVRNELLNISATSQHLRKYETGSGDLDVELWKEDMHEFLSRYPWYDRETTEQNLMNDIIYGGEREIQPRGCQNENMQRFCIGFEKCQYSIWGSTDFAESATGFGTGTSSDW